MGNLVRDRPSLRRSGAGELGVGGLRIDERRDNCVELVGLRAQVGEDGGEVSHLSSLAGDS
jgi:hypothetical protein